VAAAGALSAATGTVAAAASNFFAFMDSPSLRERETSLADVHRHPQVWRRQATLFPSSSSGQWLKWVSCEHGPACQRRSRIDPCRRFKVAPTAFGHRKRSGPGATQV
jgi:hypothetical protein